MISNAREMGNVDAVCLNPRSVAVVGAGTIGVGVAQSLAQSGHQVTLVDLSQDILSKAMKVIRDNLKLAALFDVRVRETDPVELLGRIQTAQDYAGLADVDMVVENITESWEAKAELYPRMDRICRPGCVFAVNTSAISIGRLAATTQRPDRVVGMHFMNPVPQKPVVEVVRTSSCSEQTIAAATALLRQMGKRGVIVNDHPGFVANRVLMLTLNEAMFVLQDGVADASSVDDIFVNCFGHAMGPLATADLIGLDTVLLTLEGLEASCADAKFHPCELLKQMVKQNRLGRKTGSGFHRYTGIGRRSSL